MAEIIWETSTSKSNNQEPVEEHNEENNQIENNDIKVEDNHPSEQVHLKDKPGFIDIGNGILKYPDLLNQDDYSYLLFQCDALDDESWSTHPTDSEIYGRISTPLSLQTLNSTIIEAIINEYWTNEHNTINRTRPGDNVNRIWGGADTWKAADYVVCYYLGEWTNGEVVVLSDGSEILPEPNTLYCFPIDGQQVYQSKAVTSGIKYSFVDWIYKHGDWVMG